MTLLDNIQAAVAVEVKLDKLNSEDRNLTSKAAVSEAIKQGGVMKEAEIIGKVLKAGGPDAAQISPAVRRLQVATRNFSRTSVLHPTRMSSYLGDAVEALGHIGVSRASLMLFVVKSLANEPIWGQQESPDALNPFSLQNRIEHGRSVAHIATFLRRTETEVREKTTELELKLPD